MSGGKGEAIGEDDVADDVAARRGRPRDAMARARVVEAATDLFAGRGFVTTTVAEIAAAAGVSVQTIYSAYSSKVGVLAAVHDVALAGDDEPVPLVERPWFRALGTMPTAADALDAALEQMCASTVRVAPVYAAMLAAEADPEVAALLRTLRAQRVEFSRLVVQQVGSRPGARTVDGARAADLVYATESVESHELLVSQRGWTAEAWRAWVRRTIATELLDQG